MKTLSCLFSVAPVFSFSFNCKGLNIHTLYTSTIYTFAEVELRELGETSGTTRNCNSFCMNELLFTFLYKKTLMQKYFRIKVLIKVRVAYEFEAKPRTDSASILTLSLLPEAATSPST